MKLHFPNRKEARAYCKSKGLKYTVISDTGRRKSAVRWVVDAPSAEFVAGRQYKLVNREGFIRHPSQVSPSPSQMAQAREIAEKGNGIVKIDRIEHGTAYIDLTGTNYAFRTLDQTEAIYFTEVAEAKPEPSTTPKSKPTVKAVGTIAPQPDLEAELDGTPPPAPTVESSDSVWIVGHRYKLVDEVGFLSVEPTNRRIVETVNAHYKGVYEVETVNTESGGANLKPAFTNNYLYKTERTFFRDITEEKDKPTLAELTAKELESLDVRIVAKKEELTEARRNASKVEDELRALITSRVDHSQALIKAVLGK